MIKEICDVKTLSNYLKISIPELRKLVREKKIPYFRIGNRIKFDKNKIDLWINNLEKQENEYYAYFCGK